jgi:hypothetical protein
MPIYLFECIAKPSVIHEVFYRMDDTKEYAGPNGDQPGKWRRVWCKPGMAIDSVPYDPYSASDFARVTNKAGKMDDLWQRSAEMSARRADKEGTDPVKTQFYDQYSAKHKGKLHPAQVQEKQTEDLKKIGVNIDWGDQSAV